MQRDAIPKISITIPTYNQDKFIARAVESALEQDYQNLEIIVSDDCSSDRTQEVIERYCKDSRLRYFKNKHNLGRIPNYKNTLLERVTGKWALNLDGDDYLYEKHAISHMVSSICKYKKNDLVAVMGPQLTKNTQLGISTRPHMNNPTGLFEGLDIFLNWDKLNFGHSAILYNVDLARTIDYYRLDIISSDWESILRLILHGKVIVSKNLVSVWCIHGDNITVKKSITEGIDDYSYIEETYKYALEFGIEAQKMRDWHRRMIRFHTKGLWSANGCIVDKVSLLIPYVLRNYTFAVTKLLSPEAAMKNMLRLYPRLYNNMQYLYLKHRDTQR